VTAPIDQPMLDRGRVGIGTLVAVAVACIGMAMGWQDVKSTDAAHSNEIAELKQAQKANAETLAAICEALQCRAKGIAK